MHYNCKCYVHCGCSEAKQTKWQYDHNIALFILYFFDNFQIAEKHQLVNQIMSNIMSAPICKLYIETIS